MYDHGLKSPTPTIFDKLVLLHFYMVVGASIKSIDN